MQQPASRRARAMRRNPAQEVIGKPSGPTVYKAVRGLAARRWSDPLKRPHRRSRIPWMRPGLAGLLKVKAQQLGRIERGALPVDGPVQMRSGHAARGAAEA